MITTTVLDAFFLTYFVSIFEFSIVCTPVLDRIVCQVDQSVLHILECVLFAGRPQVAILVEVALQITVNSGGDRVESNIEFPIFVE